MKLRYNFEYIEMDDELVGVPIGENAEKFHGMIKINDISKEMLEILKDCSSPEEALDKLHAKFPEEDKKELGQYLCDFLNLLIREGILEP